MFEIEKEFKKSLQRISQVNIDGLGFLDYFYKEFLNSSDEIAELFSSTNFENQTKMLKKSIAELVRFYSEKTINQHLLAIGSLHSKTKLNIRPEMYDIWLTTLLNAVKKFDPEFHTKTELIWRIILAPGIAYMKFAYDHPNLL